MKEQRIDAVVQKYNRDERLPLKGERCDDTYRR